MAHNFENLKKHILVLSEAQTFDIAKKECELAGFELFEDFTNCPCGQYVE
ncbi:MAG: hypothetical protein KAS17_01375 [Victivallaceae bacterium]|nr:hypothetical protein [Victivallaceae bacterium]